MTHCIFIQDLLYKILIELDHVEYAPMNQIAYAGNYFIGYKSYKISVQIMLIKKISKDVNFTNGYGVPTSNGHVCAWYGHTFLSIGSTHTLSVK
jgi:hypothetical protein